MTTVTYNFPRKDINCYFDASVDLLDNISDRQRTILVTDDTIFQLHAGLFEGRSTIVIPAGEKHKQQSTVDFIIGQLIEKEADRNTFIVGVGGGVVTDITGYAASIYMRGLKFGFIPTTILAMVDASIGGKNGVDVGVYKNLVGRIEQPAFLLYDFNLLKTLPKAEWINGFAEIIKHACIKDAAMFDLLENNSVADFMSSPEKLSVLIQQNVALKCSVVISDEFEKADRKLLNFGHTFGHAIENIYELPHGHAVSIGIIKACVLSEEINELPSIDKQRITILLEQYGLPVAMEVDTKTIFTILKMDKKRAGDAINFILLNKIGEAVIKSVPLVQLEHLINQSL